MSAFDAANVGVASATFELVGAPPLKVHKASIGSGLRRQPAPDSPGLEAPMKRTGAHGAWRVAAAFLGLAMMETGLLRAQPTSLGPSQLVATLHQVNRMEIAAGQMAEHNGASQGVKDFGQTLVRDHQAADDQLTAYARNQGMDLNGIPATVENEAQKFQAKLTRLQNVRGPAFDRQFALNMAKGDETVIALIDGSRPRVRDEALVVLLDRLEPTLRKHHEMAENILNGSSGSASSMTSAGAAAQGRRSPKRP